MCVRVTSMNGVDLRRFEFDYDVTWNAFFLDERLNVYSRYGGRDAGDPERRLSKEALLQTMRSVLAAHAERKAYPERGEKLLQPTPAEPSRPEDIPLLKKSHQGCVHCHQVREYQLLQWSHDGAFDRRKLFGWPLPENVGLQLDLNHGTRLARVAAGSAAEKAGAQPGDELLRMNGVPVRSEYDVRWVLHRAEDDRPMPVTVLRGEGRREVSLTLRAEGDWRPTDLSWRKSMRSVPLPFGFRGYALSKSQRADAEVAQDALAVRVVAVRPRSLAESLDLRKGDLITSVSGESGHLTIEQLLSDLLRRFRPGDPVQFTVRREGETLSLKGKFPAWHTDETTVP